MLIDATYFTAGPRQIYNATLGSGTTKENAVIEQYITEYQEEFLCRVLGQKAGESVQEYLHNLNKGVTIRLSVSCGPFTKDCLTS